MHQMSLENALLEVIARSKAKEDEVCAFYVDCSLTGDICKMNNFEPVSPDEGHVLHVGSIFGFRVYPVDFGLRMLVFAPDLYQGARDKTNPKFELTDMRYTVESGHVQSGSIADLDSTGEVFGLDDETDEIAWSYELPSATLEFGAMDRETFDDVLNTLGMKTTGGAWKDHMRSRISKN